MLANIACRAHIKLSPGKPLKSFKPRRRPSRGFTWENQIVVYGYTGTSVSWGYWEWGPWLTRARLLPGCNCCLQTAPARPTCSSSSLLSHFQKEEYSPWFIFTLKCGNFHVIASVWTRGNLYIKCPGLTPGCVQSAADFVACFLGHLVNAISFGHTHRAHRLCQCLCFQFCISVCASGRSVWVPHAEVCPCVYAAAVAEAKRRGRH